LNMGPDFWERYVNPDSRYRYDEKTHRLYHNRNEFWLSEEGTLKQNYNKIRDSEIQTRNREIFHNVIHFYYSRNGIIVLFISLVFCLLSSTLTIEGLFFWNIILLMIVMGYYGLTVRKEVRAEWDDIQEEIDTI
jgi:hypothetical protein